MYVVACLINVNLFLFLNNFLYQGTILFTFSNCSSLDKKPLANRKSQASSSAEESGGDSSAELDAAGSTKDSEASREPELNPGDSDDERCRSPTPEGS